MTRARAWIVTAIALVAVATGALVASRLLGPPNHGSAEPFFTQTFRDLDGHAEAMTRWRGRVVVVNFWATWCAPCVEEMPLLQSVQDEYDSRGVSVVGLGIDSPSALRQFRDQHRLSLPLYAAGATGSELGRVLGNPAGALPFTVVIGRDGRIVASRLGQLKAADLRRWLDDAGIAARS